MVRLLGKICLFIPIFAAQALAVPGDTIWTRLYDAGANDISFSVRQAPDGGYVLAGWTNSVGDGNMDFYLIRTNAAGDTLWTRTYGGPDDDVATSVQVTGDGGVVIAGWTKSFGAGGTDFYLVKTDYQGIVIWTNTFGGAREDTAKCVQQTSDGGYVLCGSTNSFDNGYQADVYVVKTDQEGHMVWDHRSGGVVNDGAACIIQSKESGYALTGRTGNGEGNHNIYVEKLDLGGHTVWSRGFSPGVDNQGASIIQANDDNYIIAGYTFQNPRALDFLMMKISSQGGELWTRTYGSDLWEVAYCVRQTPDHGFILAGGKWITLLPDTTQLCLVKTDSTGTLSWSRAYPVKSIDEATSVTLTDDGNYAIGGYSCDVWPYSCDFCLIKIEGGWSTAVSDAAPVSRRFVLEDNYPNPFNAQTVIRYNLSVESQVRIEIYDIVGRSIASFDNGEQSPGYHQLIWDADNQPSGIYFLRVIAGEYSEIKKMTLLK